MMFSVADSVFWTPNIGSAMKNYENQCFPLLLNPFCWFDILVPKSRNQFREKVSILCQVWTPFHEIDCEIWGQKFGTNQKESKGAENTDFHYFSLRFR